jgi:hypothetical protein
MYFRKSILLMGSLVCLLWLTGCSTGLEGWVAKKDFVFAPDYKESPIMGHIIQDNILVINPCIANRSTSIPLVEKPQSQVIEGSEKIKKLLQDVTRTSITGNFFQAKQAILTVRDISSIKLTELVPTGQCNNYQMEMITEVLTAAGMSVAIKDAKGNDITFLFKPVSETAVPSDVVFGRLILISGRTFNLGYKTKMFSCKPINQKDILINRDQTVNDADVALQLRYLDYQKQGYENIALMRIMVSGFIPEKKTEVNRIKSNQFFKSQDPEEIWESAHKPENGRLELTQGGIVQIFEGVRGGLAAKALGSGVYFEVLSITERAVQMRIQYISYTMQ